MSHNIGTPQDIVAAAALASECEANGEPFPIYKLPTPFAMKKLPISDIALMRQTFAAPSYRTTHVYVGSSPLNKGNRRTRALGTMDMHDLFDSLHLMGAPSPWLGRLCVGVEASLSN